MHYQIKTLFQVKYEDIHKVVHPYLLSAYYQKTRLISCLDDYDILLVEQLPFFDGVLDPSGNIRYDVDFTLRGHLNYLIKQHQLGGNKVRHVGGAYRPVVEQPKPEKEQADTKENRRRDAYQAMVSPKKELSKHEKKHGVTKKTINAMSPTIEEMLANPELDGISSVNIDPVSMAVETVVDLIEDVKEFIEKPSLSGIAAMAVTAIPGKVADKVLDAIPVKNIVKTIEYGDGKAIYHVDADTGLTLYSNGLITGPHPKRRKGILPNPVGGRGKGDHRGHLIPEGGVDSPSFVNVSENLISESPNSNLRLKKSLDIKASKIAAQNPNAEVRFMSEPIRKIGEKRPFAVTHYIVKDGEIIDAVSVLNK